MEYMIVMSNGELYHSGIKGQKWGVRRYQNPDGTLTEAGKKRYRVNSSTGELERKKMDSETKKKIAKGVSIGVGVTAAAAVAIYATKNSKVVTSSLEKAKSIKMNKMGPNPTFMQRGKVTVKKINDTPVGRGMKEGVSEGLKDGVKKFTRSVLVGATMVGGHKALEKAVGKKIADQMMSANDPKQIGKFYKKTGAQPNRDDDD